MADTPPFRGSGVLQSSKIDTSVLIPLPTPIQSPDAVLVARGALLGLADVGSLPGGTGGGGTAPVAPVVVAGGSTTTIAAYGVGVLVEGGSGPTTVTLPALTSAIVAQGAAVTIADDGTAAAGPITVKTSDGSTLAGVSGAAGLVINQNYGTLSFRPMSLTRWSRV